MADFHRLGVDVLAIDRVYEDFSFFAERRIEFAILHIAIAPASLGRVIVVIPAVIGNQQVENSEEKRAAAAGNVGKAHLGDLVGALSRNEFPDRIFNDIPNDVFGRVVNAPGLANLRLWLNANAFVRGDDHVAKEALVD